MPLNPSSFASDPELVQVLQSKSSPVHHSETKVLFNQGEEVTGLYILRNGAATISSLSGGSDFKLLVQTTAGALLGLPCLFGEEPYPFTTIVHGGSELSFLSRENFFALVEAHPHLSRKMLQLLASEVQSVRQAILDQICMGSELSDAAPLAELDRREAHGVLPYVGWLPTELAG